MANVNKKLPIYKFMIDEYDDETGMNIVSITDIPANAVKGFAFEENNKNINEFIFEDEAKLRITAPLLITDYKMYKEIDGVGFYGVFEADQGELVYKKFLKNLTTTEIFNEKHTDKMVDGYLFETIIMDSQDKLDFYNNLYNTKMGLNSSIMTVQFNNKDAYIDAVSRELTGLSLEGMFELIKVDFEQSKNKIANMANENENVIEPARIDKVENQITQLTQMFENFIKSQIKNEDEIIDEKIEDEVELKDEVDDEVDEKVDAKVDAKVEDEVDAKVEDETELEDENKMNVLMTKIDELMTEVAQLKAKQIEESKDVIVDEVFENTDMFFENIKRSMNIDLR